MADYSKLTKRELVMTLYARDLMLENERKRLEYLPEKYFELKQQLHDLPNKIVGEITNELSNNTSLYFEMRESTSAHCPNKEYEWFNYVRFRNYINTILEKYGDKNEINND